MCTTKQMQSIFLKCSQSEHAKGHLEGGATQAFSCMFNEIKQQDIVWWDEWPSHIRRLAGQFVFKAVASKVGVEVPLVIGRSLGHIPTLTSVYGGTCSDCPPHHHYHWEAMVHPPRAWLLSGNCIVATVCSWIQGELWVKCRIAISPKELLSNFTYVLTFNLVQEQIHNYLLKSKL